MKYSFKKTSKWLFVLVLCITGISVVSQGFIMIPIDNELIIHFHIHNDSVYFSSSVFSIFYALGFLFFAPLSNRFGKKKMIVSGLIALSICTLVIGFCKIYSLFLFFRALQGFVAATYTPLALAYVFELFPPKNQGKVIGLLSTSFTMSSILGQLLSSWFMSHYQFPILFYAFACILFFSGVILYLILPTSAKHHEPLSIKYWVKMFGLFQKRQLVVSYVITFTQFLSFVAIYSSLHHLLTQTHKMTNHEILLFQCLGLIAMCISPFITSFISKVGAPKMITLGLTITCIGTLLFITGTSIYLLSLTNILFVGGISLVLPAVIFHIGHNSGERKGVAMALYTFTLFLGSSLGPFIGARMNFEYVSVAILIILSIAILSTRYLKQEYF